MDCNTETKKKSFSSYQIIYGRENGGKAVGILCPAYTVESGGGLLVQKQNCCFVFGYRCMQFLFGNVSYERGQMRVFHNLKQ